MKADGLTLLLAKVKQYVRPDRLKANAGMHDAGQDDIPAALVDETVTAFSLYAIKQYGDRDIEKAIDVLDWLTGIAKEWRTTPPGPQNYIDAILVGTINSFAGDLWGIDYALYARDLTKTAE